MAVSPRPRSSGVRQRRRGVRWPIHHHVEVMDVTATRCRQTEIGRRQSDKAATPPSIGLLHGASRRSLDDRISSVYGETGTR